MRNIGIIGIALEGKLVLVVSPLSPSKLYIIFLKNSRVFLLFCARIGSIVSLFFSFF